MRPADVPFHEMDGWSRDDDGTDPLDGHHGAGHAGDLALFAEDLRNVFPETAVPERVAEDHIAAMIGAFQLLADKGESALEPTSNAHGPDRRDSGLPKLRRRTMKERMILRLTVTAGLLVSLAGLANAGVLPDPIQGTVENVLGIDGITVDDGDQVDVADVEDNAAGDVDDADQAAVEDDDQATADDGAADDVDENDQGDADENDQGDVDEGDQGGIEDEDQADPNDGGQADEDEGDQGNADEGDQGAADESSQSDADGGDEGADGGSND